MTTQELLLLKRVIRLALFVKEKEKAMQILDREIKLQTWDFVKNRERETDVRGFEVEEK